LAPGDSTVVELIFGTKTSKGKISKNARISCNDSVRAAITIDFSANIVTNPDTVSNVRLSPDQLIFSKDKAKFSVKVDNFDTSEVRLTQVGPLPDGVTAKIKNERIKAGKNTTLEFAWKGVQPEYDANHVATFDTGLKGIPRFSIPYTVSGTKGPKPGPVLPPKTSPTVVKPNANGEKPGANAPGQPIVVPNEKENLKKVSPDSVKLEKPLPGTQQWPPK
jgi:hypothetical protein